MLLRSILAAAMAAGAAPAMGADGAEILGRVARTYREMRTLAMEATVVLETGANQMRLEIPMTAARRGSGEARIDVSNPMMSTQTVSDGQHVWKYADRLGQYTKRSDLTAVDEGVGLILAGEATLNGLKSAEVRGVEKVAADGRAVECDVVEAVYVQDGPDQARTYWVDRRRHWILKMRLPVEVPGNGLAMTETITVSSIRAGQRLADALFRFAPPAGAVEVESFTAANRARPEGR